jgi:hypothetical protein
MIRSIAIGLLLLTAAFGLSHFMVGYERGGSHYIARQREQRKSIRVGSHGAVYYRGGPYSTGGPRFGK